jgi:viroplasmin and RNaseH domain-containing protein
MTWYIVFRGRNLEYMIYEGVCSEYVVGFSGAAFQSYSTRMQAEKAYVAFVEH